jgi:steroid delta-isomerase-like uncharacterized protein
VSVEETERVMRSYEEALDHGGDFSSFFAEDVLWTTMETGDQLRGREAVRDYLLSFHRQYFHGSPELRGLVVADGSAAAESLFVGRHIAEFAGIPASGKEVRTPYSMFYSVDDGKITELRSYFPFQALIQQLTGAMEART